MSKKTEKIVDLLINEEHDKANQALRDLMIEKSRRIYNESETQQKTDNNE